MKVFWNRINSLMYIFCNNYSEKLSELYIHDDLHTNSTSRRPGAKTIKKNTNSTQNKSQTHNARAYAVMSFLSTDCELSTETCSRFGPWLDLLFFEITNLGLVAFLLIKHFCAHKLYTTVKVHSINSINLCNCYAGKKQLHCFNIDKYLIY